MSVQDAKTLDQSPNSSSVSKQSTTSSEVSRVLEGMEPAPFFHFFEEISRIPRGSYNEKQVSDYVARFAEERGLEFVQDDVFNILVRKPGTKGYEAAAPVIFHGHTDIVCEKEDGVEHDFQREGIKLRIDGDFIKGTGTTLGADNTVGVALALSVLDSTTIAHPPLEVVLTVQEEVGKGGAQKFDGALLSGRRLIDFNWHDPKTLFAGCAGDISAWLRIPIEWRAAAANLRPMTLRIKGLSSGHSEFDIHLERANGIVCLARALVELGKSAPIAVASMAGGVNRYVIPNECEALILVHPDDVPAVEKATEKLRDTLAAEYRTSDPNLELAVAAAAAQPSRVFSEETTQTVTKAISLLPVGVQSMSLSIPGLVESSNTVALLATEADHVGVLSTIPSAVSSRRYNILRRIENLADVVGRGASVSTFADCPEWPFNPHSPLLAVAKDAFRAVTGEEPHVEVSHSSLELGLFNKKIPGIDMLSIGPEAFDVHTTRERLNHTTVEPVWRLLKEILKNLH